MQKSKLVSAVLVCALLAGCSGVAILSKPIEAVTTASAHATGSAVSTAKPGKSTAPAKQTKPGKSSVPAKQTKPAATATPAAAGKPVEIDIMAVGDIMCHSAQIKGAYDKKTGSYDFDYSFQYIKDIISSADLALGNFECTLGGPDVPYSQMKYFNAPDTVIDALKWTGFDVLSTINNHAYDTGSAGLRRTVDVIRSKGLQNVGTRADADEPPFIITDVKGIKVGIAAYSYETSSQKNAIALNGRPVKTDDKDLISVFYAGNSSAEVARMSKTVQSMREAGADLVVFFLHWGNEYQRYPSAQQKAMAQGLADAGVDVIFGSHPHVMQKIDTIESEKTGKKTVVVYSMGNFISNMREEYMDDPYTEDGVIVDVKATRDSAGVTAVSAVQYLPTWTFMYTSQGLRRYTVVPLPQAVQSPGDFGIVTSKDKRKAQKSLDNTLSLFSEAQNNGILSPFQPGK